MSTTPQHPKPTAGAQPRAGTTPAGTQNREQAAEYVRGMFGRVAPRYDFLNHLLSFQLDRRWRKRTIRELDRLLARPETRILDVCCGTGDLLLALEDKAKGKVFGSDFCHPMLLRARSKSKRSASLCAAFRGRRPAPARS